MTTTGDIIRVAHLPHVVIVVRQWEDQIIECADGMEALRTYQNMLALMTDPQSEVRRVIIATVAGSESATAVRVRTSTDQ